VPFQRPGPDPDSDVVAFLSLYVWHFVCEECRLSSVGRTEVDTRDETAAHFDAHRAAGHRVPDQFYEDLKSMSYWDDAIRTTYSSRWRAEDENLTVTRLGKGEGLHCFRCALNSGRDVKCFSTEQMVQHLDEHQTWGLPVPQHVYEKLARHRSENDELFANYYQQRGESLPPTLLYEPPPLLPHSEAQSHRDGLDTLSSMLATAISHFEGPLSESDRAAGWTETHCGDAAEVLRSVLHEVEVAKRDQGIDFRGADWKRLCTNWTSEIRALEDRLKESHKAPFDPPYEALDELSGFIHFEVTTEGRSFKEWLARPHEKG
jgi:hypothetical protein